MEQKPVRPIPWIGTSAMGLTHHHHIFICRTNSHTTRRFNRFNNSLFNKLNYLLLIINLFISIIKPYLGLIIILLFNKNPYNLE